MLYLLGEGPGLGWWRFALDVDVQLDGGAGADAHGHHLVAVDVRFHCTIKLEINDEKPKWRGIARTEASLGVSEARSTILPKAMIKVIGFMYV